MGAGSDPEPTELVVNLHVTERCNYACSFCFGKWGLGSTDGVFADPRRACLLLSDVFDVLSASEQGTRGIRFNFAGGEPALLPALPELVAHCRALGARTSFVSNGLMLRRFDAPWISRNFDLVGLSVDSASEPTNLRIGRATRSGRVFDVREVIAAVRALRAVSGCPVKVKVKLKVNTVVCRWNVREDLSRTLRALAPDTWKVLQMLPVYGSADAVSAADFAAFVRRHAEFADVMVVEDNDRMIASYLMVDPLGRFFWTSDEAAEDAGGYMYSRPILEVGAAVSFRECSVSWEKYAQRYSMPLPESAGLPDNHSPNSGNRFAV
jgi:radical S-adenosyl methionine domain-containing protein 2